MPPPLLPTLHTQQPIVGLDLGEEAEAAKARSVYLVTFPHPKQATTATGRPLVAPGSKSRGQMLEIFLESCANPIYVDPRSRARQESIPMDKLGLFREPHAEDATGVAQEHDHVAAKGERQFMYMPVKRALLERYGLASHWSCTHVGYWSAIRYLYWPSPPKKPAASLDNAYVLWSKPPLDHPPLDECCNEPATAAAQRARRVRIDRAAADEGKAAARIQEIDVWPIVVQNNIRNTHDDMHGDKALLAWALDSATIPMRDFLFKNRARLNMLIDDCWRLENVKADLAEARLNRMEVLQAALKRPCACKGVWAFHVQESWRLNHIDAAALCADIKNALEVGRNESVPVLVLAGARGGEGKSIFLKALFKLFGDDHVFISPEEGRFPLVDLPGKKVAFLDEWRFDDQVLSYSTQCLWMDGSAVLINRPQNQQGICGHLKYRGTAPIFATSKLSDIEALAEAAADDPVTGVPKDSEASMLYRRLKVYPYFVRIPKPPPNTPFCAYCFSYMLLHGGAAPP